MTLYNTALSVHALFHDLQIPCNLTATKEIKQKDVNGLPAPSIFVPVIIRSRAVAFMMDTLHPIMYQNHIYVYDYNRRKYVPDANHIKTFFTHVLNHLNIRVYDKELLEEAGAAVLATNTGDQFPFNPRCDAVNCKNGIVLLTENGRVLVPHDQNSYQYLFNYCIGTDYNAEYEHNTQQLYTIFDQWGSRVFCVDCISVGVAQSLLKDTFKTAFMVEGGQNAGKTTLLELVQQTMGDDAYSQEGLYELAKSAFSLFNVEGKIANLGDEAQTLNPVTTERFKKITGSVWQPLQKKHQQGRNGLVTASYIFACNDLPEVSNVSDAVFFGRWWIEEFKNTFETNPQKKKEILSQSMREQYLVRILERVQDIITNGFRRPANKTADDTEEYWKARTVGAMLWMSECVESCGWNESIVSLTELHHHYSLWCPAQERKFAPVSDKALRRKLEERGFGIVRPQNVIHFRGIRFTTPSGDAGVDPNIDGKEQQATLPASDVKNPMPHDIASKKLNCISECGAEQTEICECSGIQYPNCIRGMVHPS